MAIMDAILQGERDPLKLARRAVVGSAWKQLTRQ